MWHRRDHELRRAARRPGRRAPDVRGARAPRARRRGVLPLARGRPGHEAAEHHRPGHGPPARAQRGRRGVGRLQRRDLQLQGAAAGAGGARPRVLHGHGHGGHRPPLRGEGAAPGRGPARDVRLRGVGRARPEPAARPRPRGHQAPLLRRGGRAAGLRLGGEGAPAAPLGGAGRQLDVARPRPRLPRHSARGEHRPRGAQARPRQRPRGLAGRSADRPLLAARVGPRSRAERGGDGRGAARARGRVRAPAHGE